METKLLYLDDSYAREFDAKIIDVIEISVSENDTTTQAIYFVLDQTLFYAKGGGQPCDIGVVERSGVSYPVFEVIKREGRVLHKVDRGGLKIGDEVHGTIDWNRRHMLMRMHTASHLLDAVLYRDGKILVTGNELGIDKSRIDFNMPEFSMDKVQEYVNEANRIIAKDLAVKNYYLSREEAFKIPGIVKLAGALPPDIPILRITEIVGLDIQADGGTHVNSLGEIGKINILNIENKGRERKRICYTLSR
ncbi:MAG: alanyl-tRNA editing protein [Candidatus Woesearchaeota archaeon]